MTNLKISIGLPFYNNENTLELTIKSILCQTYKSWELILINDGSTDNSNEIAEKYSSLYPNIVYINDKINKGLIFRLNQIIDISQYDFIARIDADDLMLSARLEKQIKVFEKNKEIDIVASSIYTIDENNKPIGVRYLFDISKKTKKDVLKKSLFAHPSIMVKKSWYQQNKYDYRYERAEDYELWNRTFSKTNIYCLHEPLTIYREGNVNIKNYLKSMKTLRKILRKYSTNLSIAEFLVEFILTYLKSLAYIITGMLNLQKNLTKKRNITLEEGEKKLINNFINSLKS